MSFFKDSEHLKEILGGFFEELTEVESIKGSLLKSAMIIKFNYEHPDASITIDSHEGEIKIFYDSMDPKPDVEMKMRAEVAHKFWLGKVNLPMALARRQIIAKGQIPKVLKLLPIVKPAYKLYPEYLSRHGYSLVDSR